MLQQTTDADTISFMFCFSFMVVFKFIAATTTGGILEMIFEVADVFMFLGESTVTSNLHQLTCKYKQDTWIKTRRPVHGIKDKKYTILQFDAQLKISPLGKMSL